MFRVATEKVANVHVILISTAISRERGVATPATAKENHSARVCYVDEKSAGIVREAFLCWRMQFVITRVILPVRNRRAKSASFGVAISHALVSAR